MTLDDYILFANERLGVTKRIREELDNARVNYIFNHSENPLPELFGVPDCIGENSIFRFVARYKSKHPTKNSKIIDSIINHE